MLEILEEAWEWICQINIQAALTGPLLTLIAYSYKQGIQQKIYIGNLIQEIEELACEHWCGTGADTNNRSRATKINSKLQTLSWKINQDSKNIRDAFIEYRQAITSDPFEEPTRPSIDFDDTRILLISLKAKQLRKISGIKKHH